MHSDEGSKDRQGSGTWWATLPGILTGIAAVITALTALGALLWPRSEDAVRDTTPPPAVVPPRLSEPTAQPSVPAGEIAGQPLLPKVMLDGPDSVSFVRPRSATYSVLGLEVSPGPASQYELRVLVRCLNTDDQFISFKEATLRLVIDDVPRAPHQSPISLFVEANSAKDVAVIFRVPFGAKKLVLQVFHGRKTDGYVAEIPLRIVRKS